MKMMKKIALALCLSVVSTLSMAQTDAKKLLNEVAKKYKDYSSIRSDFSLSAQDGKNGSYNDKGIMYFSKAKNQYAIKMQNQEIISDGKTIWNIAKDLQEIQITDAEENDATIGPTNLFTFFQKGYAYKFQTAERIQENGKTENLSVIELQPLESKTNYKKIKIRVNKNNHIHDVVVFDKSNNQFTYTLNTLYVGEKFPESTFVFNKDKYKSYEIVDLR